MSLAKRTSVAFGATLVIFYLILVPLAAYLLHGLDVSSAVYYSAVWSLGIATLFAVSYFVIGTNCSTAGRRLAVSALAALASAALMYGTLAVLSSVLTFQMWAFTPLATVGWIALMSAESTTIANLAVRLTSCSASA